MPGYKLRDGMHSRSTSPSISPETSGQDDIKHDDINLRFRPLAGVDYAKPYARAVLAGYRSGQLVQSRDPTCDLAKRVLRGEGQDLVFREVYLERRHPAALWDGAGRTLLRAAFVHILGVDAAECSLEGCLYGRRACGSCYPSATGYFEGCRHSHDISQGGQVCSNCYKDPRGCSSHTAPRDGHLKRKAECLDDDVGTAQQQRVGSIQPASPLLREEDAISPSYWRRGMRARQDLASDTDIDLQPDHTNEHAELVSDTAPPAGNIPLEHGLPTQGPFFHQIVQKTAGHDVRPKDVSKSIRHRLIDQEDHVVRAELQWVNHYRILLESELRTRGIVSADQAEA
ncbi:hypothetical protein LTR65_007824 [Meristemomyces frigidus]